MPTKVRLNEQQQRSDDLSQEWAPLAISTPVLVVVGDHPPATTIDHRTRRFERQIENELFEDIERLVRTFLSRPNREYPYYRIIRWIEGNDPKLEYGFTVVINRPVVLLDN